MLVVVVVEQEEERRNRLPDRLSSSESQPVSIKVAIELMMPSPLTPSTTSQPFQLALGAVLRPRTRS